MVIATYYLLYFDRIITRCFCLTFFDYPALFMKNLPTLSILLICKGLYEICLKDLTPKFGLFDFYLCASASLQIP